MIRFNVVTLLKTSKLFQIASVLLLAFIIRIEYLREIQDNPFFQHLVLDEKSYDLWARRIAAGEWLGKEIFYQDPLYPYFLAVLYSVIGRDLLWVRVIQLFVGSITCVLIYLLGSSFFDRTTGLVAGVIAALYGPFFYFEAMFLKAFLSTFLLCLFILLLVGARPRRSFLMWVAAGFVLGLLSLVRANTLALAAGAALWLFAIRAETEPVRRTLIAFAGFMAGLLMVVSSVCARNYVVGNDFVLLTSQAGQNFFIGNNRANQSGRYEPPSFIRPHPRHEQEDFRVRAEIAAGRELKPSEVSKYWFGEAFRFIRQEPRQWLKLVWTKFHLFWNWYEVPDNQNLYFFKRYSFLLRQRLPDFHIVAALALTGMVLCAPQWRKALLLYLVTFIYSATVITFYVFDRYRLPVVPTLIVFAAFFVTAAPRMVAQKKYLKLGTSVLLTAAFFALLGTHVTPNDYFLDDANANCRLASVYSAEGKLDDALASYELATRCMPYYWASYYGLGELYEQRNELDLALENYGKARLYNPGNVDIYMHMGRIYYQKGQLEQSAESYREAVKLKPEWDRPHYWLAKIYELQGKHEQAKAHHRKLKELTVTVLPEM